MANGNPLILGQGNSQTSETDLSGSGGLNISADYVGLNASADSGFYWSSAVWGQHPSRIGVLGYVSSPVNPWGYGGAFFGATGVYGQASSPSGFGGFFYGGLGVMGGVKSAVVPHPDGSHRLLYSMESPESWFEDFGRAKLVHGKARVKVDRTFAAVVRAGDYHVFLSPEGNSNGLYVSRKNRAGFEVRECQDGTSSVRFSYRIVARRKDVNAPRFKKISLPPHFSKGARPPNPPSAPRGLKMAHTRTD